MQCRRLSLEQNLRNVDVLIVCISRRRKGDFEFKDAQGRGIDDLFYACMRVLRAAIAEGQRRRKALQTLVSRRRSSRRRSGGSKIHPSSGIDADNDDDGGGGGGADDAGGPDDVARGGGGFGGAEGEEEDVGEDIDELDFEALNVIFVGTANHSVFEVSTGDYTKNERAKLLQEASDYDRFFRFLCEEGRPEDYFTTDAYTGEKVWMTQALQVSRPRKGRVRRRR